MPVAVSVEGKRRERDLHHRAGEIEVREAQSVIRDQGVEPAGEDGLVHLAADVQHSLGYFHERLGLARGKGLGARLVAACTTFARAAGYRRITLWTHSILVAARKLYAAEGYRLIASEPMRDFGQDLISETWELTL